MTTAKKEDDTMFSQEIDEATQPERVEELIKQSMSDIEGTLRRSGFVPQKLDDGSLAWTYDENVEAGLDPVDVEELSFDTHVFALDIDVKGMDYGQISQQLANAQEVFGLVNCEITLQGSQVQEDKHMVRIERSIGCAPFVVPRRFGSFSGLELANVKSLVFVYPISNNKAFMCAFSGLEIEKHETWCMKNGRAPDETIYINAAHGLPWRLV